MRCVIACLRSRVFLDDRAGQRLRPGRDRLRDGSTTFPGSAEAKLPRSGEDELPVRRRVTWLRWPPSWACQSPRPRECRGRSVPRIEAGSRGRRSSPSCPCRSSGRARHRPASAAGRSVRSPGLCVRDVRRGHSEIRGGAHERTDQGRGSGRSGTRLHAALPIGYTGEAVRLPGHAGRRPLLLSQGQHARLHGRGMRISRQSRGLRRGRSRGHRGQLRLGRLPRKVRKPPPAPLRPAQRQGFDLPHQPHPVRSRPSPPPTAP
jgi:hypothetical protein